MITFQRILVESGDEVFLQLRAGGSTVKESCGEAILDINAQGNWVRGLELISGFVDFPLADALKPFAPVPPLGDALTSLARIPALIHPPGTVTYDRDGDDEMGYLYLLYDDAVTKLPKGRIEQIVKINHSIENPHCRFGLDSEGGLVYVRLPMADLSSPPDILLALLKK